MDVTKALEKMAISRIKVMMYSVLGINGCLILPILLIFMALLLFIMSPFKFDGDLETSLSEFAGEADTNPIIEAVQTDINNYEDYKGFELDIIGPLIATTLQVTMTYNPYFNVNALDKYDGVPNAVELYKNDKDIEFPTYELLLDMAHGMVAKKMILTCEKEVTDADGNSHTITRTLTWVEQLVGIDGYKPKTCDDAGEGFSFAGLTHEHYISTEVYEKYYLGTKYFYRDDLKLMMDGLTDEDKRRQIKIYADDIFETYDEYIALVYGGDLSSLGIIYIDSEPVIANGMALPLHITGDPYGAPLSSPFWQQRDGHKHAGIDLSCESGPNSNVFSVYNGTISMIGYDEYGYGNFVVIKSSTDAGEVETLYGHLSGVPNGITEGTEVLAGNTIGFCGNTGHSSGYHLHFEIILKDVSEEDCSYWQSGNCYTDPEATLRAIGEETCAIIGNGEPKTYMDYGLLDPASSQMAYINDQMTVDERGFLVDDEGYIGVALGSHFGGQGNYGSKFIFKLSEGQTLRVVKVDQKSDIHTLGGAGCIHYIDGSVIEFVISESVAGQYFGIGSNGYILNGNYNNYSGFRGSIVSYEAAN